MNIHQALQQQLPALDGTYELIVGMPDDGDTSFSPNGCDLIDTLACDVFKVNCLIVRRNIAGRIIERHEFEAEVCGEVLDATANGSTYHLNKRGDWVPEHDFEYGSEK